ncbi:MAG: pyruvate kinase [Patescibacteria group bacterium]|jgi:pyruvate kinase
MRTKIIATLGPKSESPEVIAQLVKAGMDIARMNFSHCTYDEYLARTKHLRAIQKEVGRPIKIMQDLRGPRLRVSNVPKDGLELTHGMMVTFSTSTKDTKALHVSDPHLHKDISVDDPLFLVNGAVELTVRKVTGTTIQAEVIHGGRIFENTAVNVPNTRLTTAGLTAKDKEDVRFALEHGVDYIALSFVQSAKDVEDLRKLVGTKAKIIAKIERRVALADIDSIIQAADGIMVARGDLGTEMPVEEVPFIQKNLIRHAAWHRKPCIVATQMLFSMVDTPHPTRAEVSDIANAVWEAADAVMLSDETASGLYPVQALQTMAKVVKRAEHFRYQTENLL